MSRRGRSERLFSLGLTLVLLSAVVLRIGIGLYLGFNSGPDRAACGADTVEFEQMARSAARGVGFRLSDNGPATAFRAPGYPLFLACLYRLAGHRYWVNRLALSLIGTATCWLVYVLALRLGEGHGPALLAAFITAVLPLQFYWCGHFMSEPLAAFLNVATCLAMVIAGDSVIGRTGPCRTSGSGKSASDLLWAVGAGVLCGVSGLVRAGALLVPVIFAIILLASRMAPLRRSLLLVLCLFLGAALAMAPWVIRNRLVLERWVLVSTNGGSTFWGANNAVVARPGEHWGSWVSTSQVDRLRKEREVWVLNNEADRDRREWAIGVEFLRQNPGKIPWLLLGKFYRLVTPFPQSANRVYVAAVAAGQIVLLPTTLVGMVLLLRRRQVRQRFVPLNAQLVALLVTTAVFYGSERFRMPYEPFMAIYAAVALLAPWRKGGREKSESNA